MTTYFDNTHARIAALKDDIDFWRNAPEVEGRLVFDVTVAAMWPGFPPDLAHRVHKIVLQYGIHSLPVNAPPKDFESIEEHIRLLNSLCWDLHTVFHDLVLRDIPGFTDEPLTPLRALYTRGEEVRERMVAGADPAGSRPSVCTRADAFYALGQGNSASKEDLLAAARIFCADSVFYQEREHQICSAVGGVSDNGQYRADIIEHLSKLFRNYQALVQGRERIALMIPCGWATGTVEDNVRDYIQHLQRQCADLRAQAEEEPK